MAEIAQRALVFGIDREDLAVAVEGGCGVFRGILHDGQQEPRQNLFGPVCHGASQLGLRLFLPAREPECACVGGSGAGIGRLLGQARCKGRGCRRVVQALDGDQGLFEVKPRARLQRPQFVDQGIREVRLAHAAPGQMPACLVTLSKPHQGLPERVLRGIGTRLQGQYLAILRRRTRPVALEQIDLCQTIESGCTQIGDRLPPARRPRGPPPAGSGPAGPRRGAAEGSGSADRSASPRPEA